MKIRYFYATTARKPLPPLLSVLYAGMLFRLSDLPEKLSGIQPKPAGVPSKTILTMIKATTLITSLLFCSMLLRAQTPKLVLPMGHPDRLNDVAFSPDGKYILTGGGLHPPGMAKLWDLQGREILSFPCKMSVGSVAFSPDGQRVLTISDSSMLWDLQGRKIRSFPGAGAFSPDGQHLLTSAQGTATLWDFQGRTIRSFKMDNATVVFSPDGQRLLGIRENDAWLSDLQGRKTCSFSGSNASFSPDGKMILTSGIRDSAWLWDLTGRKIQAFPDGILHVFSTDGRTVLSIDVHDNGHTIHLYDLTGHEIQSFKTGWDVNCLAFSPDGKTILTGSGEHATAKLWDLQGHIIQVFRGHSKLIERVLVSPDQKHIATNGQLPEPRAELWDFEGPEIHPVKGPITSIGFLPDGKTIITGDKDKMVKLWDLKGREMQSIESFQNAKPLSVSGNTEGPEPKPNPNDRVVAVFVSEDGQRVLTESWAGRALKLWDLKGQEIKTFYSRPTKVRSPDGKILVLSRTDGINKLWNAQGHEIATFKSDSYYSEYAFSPDEKTILGCGGGPTMLWDLSGQEIQSFKGHSDYVDCVAFSPDGQRVLTGSRDKTAKLWNLKGQELQTFKGHTAGITSTFFLGDGQLVLTSSRDHTMKIWDTKTGKELASLVLIDSSDWVVTTPSGLFDASPGAMNLMYFVQGLEVIDLEQLKERYYEPGLLAKILGLDKGELRNVAALNNVALYPEITASIANGQLKVSLRARSGGMGKLSLFVNSKEVIEDANPSRLATLSIDLQPFEKYWQPGNNAIALRAYNQEGWLKSQAYELTYAPIEETKAAKPSTSTPGGPTKSFGGAKPHLYILSIGTANYSGDKMDLNFPDLDAAAMATALQSTGSRLFEDRVHLRLLSTAGKTPAEQSSKANIEAAFKEFAAQAKPQDVLVVYFSGHGITYTAAEKAQFYYLTKDIGSPELSDKAIRDNYTVSSDDLTHWLTAITAKKQVMILDACNSGKVVESLATIGARALNSSQIVALDRMKDRTGMFILTGAAADKVSYEASQYGQGLLTYSLLQGMSGLALTPDKRVDVMTLFQYSRDQVPGLAKGIDQVQVPMLAFPAGGGSFDIGIVDGTVKIPVSQVKPVFIRNNFQDEASFDDVLGLTPALADYFRGITVKGAKAELIYVDVTEYANAYSMKGRYSINGDAVEVRGRLFQGKETKGEFQVTGKKDDVPGLAQLILEKVRPLMK